MNVFAAPHSPWSYSYGLEGTQVPYPPSYPYPYPSYQYPWPVYWYHRQPYQLYQPQQRHQIPLVQGDSETSDDDSDGEEDRGEQRRKRDALKPLPLILSPPHGLSLLRNTSGPTRRRKRPSNWRSDYAPPSTLWIKRRFLELKWFIRDLTYMPIHHNIIRLHPFLQYPPPLVYPDSYSYSYNSYGSSSNYVKFDLRLDPLYPPNVNAHVLNQLAMVPPVDEVHLVHPLLPWVIVVHSASSSGQPDPSNPNGCTSDKCSPWHGCAKSHSHSSSSSLPTTPMQGIRIVDVLHALHASLMRPISVHDFYNSSMTALDREAVEEAYQVRCKGDLSELARGVRRVDWLCGRVGFVGLVGKGGRVWEVKTIKMSRMARGEVGRKW